ncbi:SDR family oxidoreductase [Salegentibacter sp. F188]|uniref:SDR family oxidoreductase n=1 Tax=Autumnicola patrickiae TaxID=3075591 RepID=A0ABU3E138_9FLAO|nr:SDR family oxidoreductase [Salegentibacter sp. F188]MDT0689705.1 SDR family oxidoreductase [Salegentibacter sp. F188]
MDLGLKGKVIIVTGGTKGIGEAISKAIAAEDGIPVFIGRTKDHGEKLLKELQNDGKAAYFISGDLNDVQTCEQIVKEVVEKFGSIYGLVNNAGANDSIGLENGSPEKFRKSLNSNLNHYYNMAHFCLESLKKSKGSIVNISSKTAITGQGGTSGYAAAKGAQLALTREWAVELLPYGVRVNAVIPAEVMTPLYESWLSSFKNPEEKRSSITGKIPLGKRMTTSEEIAASVVFLLSEKSAHTTGQHLVVDGGYTHLDRSIT